MPVSLKTAPPAPAVGRPDGAALTEVEREVIAHFVDLSRVLGQPRSYAELYGLLFISPRPLPMDDLVERLNISKGSASQGLKFLRDIGAVRAVELDDDRRTHYEAVAELRHLAGRFLRDQIGPQLVGNEARLERLADGVGEMVDADRAHVTARITMLRSWNKNIRRVLPLIVKLLGE
jgi:DNA-binding transcriptional regulator GbsR (MarR family)